MNPMDPSLESRRKRSVTWRESLAPVTKVLFGKKSDKDDDDDNYPGPGAVVTSLFPMFAAGARMAATA